MTSTSPQEPDQSKDFHYFKGLTIPVYLLACPYLSLTDKIIAHHLIYLSHKYEHKGGCNLTNKEVAIAHEVTPQTVSNVIAKLKALGWVRSAEVNKKRLDSGDYVSRRVIMIRPQQRWRTLGAIYCMAYYSPKHEMTRWAKWVMSEIRGMYEADKSKIISPADIRELITRKRVAIKKFIAILHMKREYIKRNCSFQEQIGFSGEKQNNISLNPPQSSGYARKDNIENRKTSVPADKPAPKQRRVISPDPPKNIRDALDMSSRVVLSDSTVEIVTHWNKQPNLKKHKLVPANNGTYPVHLQTKIVKETNSLLNEILNRNFYKKRTELKDEPQLRNFKPSIHLLRQAIEKFNLLGNSEYNTPKGADETRGMSLPRFLYNQHAPFEKSYKPGYRFKYRFPFIHCLLNDPCKTSSKQFLKATEFEGSVQFVIRSLKEEGRYLESGENYNDIVKCVDIAADQVRKNANGTTGEILSKLGMHIVNTMRSTGAMNQEKLFQVVNYKLVPYLREKRYI